MREKDIDQQMLFVIVNDHSRILDGYVYTKLSTATEACEEACKEANSSMYAVSSDGPWGVVVLMLNEQ